MRNQSFVTTLTGGYLSLESPSPENINLHDISEGLSHTCRFSGQLPKHYSVASHSLALAECYDTPAERLYALLHDASEAYITDMPAPVKVLCPMYSEVELGIMEAVFDKFDLWGLFANYHLKKTHIHTMDRRMASLEQYALQGDSAPAWAKEVVVAYMNEPDNKVEELVKYINVLANKEQEDVAALYVASVEEALHDYREAGA